MRGGFTSKKKLTYGPVPVHFLYEMKGFDHTYNILKFEADRIIFKGFNTLNIIIRKKVRSISKITLMMKIIGSIDIEQVI